MKQIRCGVFETNSSSTHSLCICTEDEYDKWRNGQLLYDDWLDEFKEETKLTDIDYECAHEEYDLSKNKYYKDWDDLTNDERKKYTIKYVNENNYDNRFLTYDQWKRWHDNLEHYIEHFTSPSGDKMMAFGYYGNDY